MESKDTFQSVAEVSRATFRDKASRFIAVVSPVSSEGEVRVVLETLRKEYYDANHHCYAYRLGINGEPYRMNDDGEPSGSAGRPIHGQLVSKGLSDVLAVVIRYYGGTKLGIPGLIHAYRTVTEEAIANARIVEKILKDRMTVTFGYARMNDVMKILKEQGVSILGQEADQTCRILFEVRKSRSQETSVRLTKLSDIYISIDV